MNIFGLKLTGRTDLPEELEVLGEFHFNYRGTEIELYRDGNSWGCSGFAPKQSLENIDREIRLCEDDPDYRELCQLPSLVVVTNETGWRSGNKNRTLRKICRSIDADIIETEEENAVWLEKQMIKDSQIVTV